jgi:sugar phosphate isomerase/epimerase
MPGKGGIDYEVYLRNVVALPHEAPLMLEHLRTPEEYDQARAYVLNKAKVIGIRSA